MQKVKKNLNLPQWLIELLDAEGERYGGPGMVAAMGIWVFCRLSDAQKVEAVTQFTAQEVRQAYLDAGSQEKGLAAMAKVAEDAQFRLDRVVLPPADAVAKRVKKHGSKGKAG